MSMDFELSMGGEKNFRCASRSVLTPFGRSAAPFGRFMRQQADLPPWASRPGRAVYEDKE